MPLFLVALLLSAISTHAYEASAIETWKKGFARPEKIPYPGLNPYSEPKSQLGKILFFDKRLSGDNQMSCATCHNPELGWSDDRPLGRGHKGKTLSRRVPPVENLAWGASFFWDGRAVTLEEQAKGPITNPEEMNQGFPELVQELKSVPRYQELFQAAFPKEGITEATIVQAIATFERGLISPPAPFDAWLSGKADAISESAKRGFLVFGTKAQCTVCHDRWNFTTGIFADTGLKSNDPGMGAFDKSPWIQHHFKTPSLRNVTRRKFFMHDGSLKSLAAVIDFYNRGGDKRRPTIHFGVRPLGLNTEEKADLLNFLATLTSETTFTPPTDRALAASE